MWLGLPAGRFQSGCTCRIHAARARWWSSRGKLQAIWPKRRRPLLVTRWESGEQVNQWFFWLPHLTYGKYTASLRSCIVNMCQMHRGERAGTLWWPNTAICTNMACFYSVCKVDQCARQCHMLLLSPERRRQSLGSARIIFDESGESSNLVTSASTFPETSLVWDE